MSIKTKVFETLLHGFGPARTFEFLVIIPELYNTSLIATNLTFPTVNVGEVSLYFWGELFRFPSVEESTGDWQIRVPESPTMSQKWEVLKAMTKQNIYGTLYRDISVFPLHNLQPIPGITLKNCWIKGRTPVHLGSEQVTEPWFWEVNFVHNGISESVSPYQVPGVADAILALNHSI